jgi:hypothetical protein
VLLTDTHSCGRSACSCTELAWVVVDKWLASYVGRASKEAQKHRGGEFREAKKTSLSATSKGELKRQNGHFLRTFRVCVEGALGDACSRQHAGHRNKIKKREASDELALG